MEPHAFQYLFSPIDLGSITVRNRIVSTAHNTGFPRGGIPNEREITYHEVRAKGGVGLIILGAAPVHDSSLADEHRMRITDDRIIPAYQKLQKAVHKYGAKIMAQLSHMGRMGETFDSPFPLYAPSAISDEIRRETPAEMEIELIEELIEAFGKAAYRARKGGLDGVEIHGGHSSLVAQFMSPYANQRTDDYGGSREKCLRFPIEVIKSIRKQVGRDFTVGIRISGDEFVDGGLTLEDVKMNAADLEATGLLDFFDITAGTDSNIHSLYLHYPPMSIPLGNLTYLAASIREIVNIPIIAVGRINDPILAEKILADGMADLVGMTRAAICDPDFPNKAKEGLLDEIRHCVGCNQGCFTRIHRGQSIYCIQNPSAGREAELGELTRVSKSHKVAIVGGGAAGMEAARVAAKRGHHVLLFEKSSELGGQIKIAARAPEREEFEGVVRYLEGQIRKLNIDLYLETEVTEENIFDLEPDSVVIATGAKPLVSQIEGIEAENSYTAWDVLQGKVTEGQKYVVIDGDKENQVAIGTAEYLAELGKEVEIITRLTHVGKDLDLTNLVPVYQRLFEKKIKLTPHTGLRAVKDHCIVLFNIYTDEEELREGIDGIVLALGRVADDSLYKALKGKIEKLYRIGDCFAPRTVMSAINEGTRIGRMI